jgi:hypothetical protein
MYNPKAPPFATEGTRSLLKNQHKKIYSICRLFASNYKELQRLFAGTVAAAARSIGSEKAGEDKGTLLLRACINMAALYSLSGSLGLFGKNSGDPGKEGQFKSPDYQRNMMRFREAVGDISDYEKILLFLHFEHIAPAEIPRLSGLPVSSHRGTDARVKKSFIPYLKEKLIWS